MDLKKSLGAITAVTRQTVRHPVDTGLKAVGRSIGLVRGTARVVAGAVSGHRTEEPVDRPPEPPHSPTDADQEPRTQTPGDLPTPTDLAEQVSPTDEVTTPVGTTGAGEAYNPDTGETDLQQPGTEPLMDPATTKEVASESETLRRGAEKEP
jgi:hypothetical protein